MKLRYGLMSIGLLGALVAGCETILGFLNPSNVTVVLSNSGSFPVDATLYIDNDQNILEALLTSIGQRLDYTVNAGQSVSFSRDCADLQAIIVQDANLQVAGSIGPDTSSRVYRDGTDFNCGDTIEFAFDHPALPISLGVTFSQR